MLKKSDSNMINDDTFSSRDDDLLEAMEMNPRLLSQFSYYSTTNFMEFLTDSIETHLVVGHMIEKLVQEGSRRLYDKYIGTKLPNHVLVVSKEYLEIMGQMEFQKHDRC